MPVIASDDAAARRGTRREAVGSPTMDGGLARQVKADLRAQGLRRVLVDQAVLRQLAGLSLGPDEEAERARRRDTAERELAGSRLDSQGAPRSPRAAIWVPHGRRKGARPGPETAEAGLPSARGDPAARPGPSCPSPIVPAGAWPAGWELPC
jgi:hypothetical protein